MDISSVSNASFNRSVSATKNSHDRQTNDEAQAALLESKAQERAQQQREAQQKLQQRNAEEQRRLDGRLISFGHEQDNSSSEQKQASFNRSRVNEAYSPPKDNLSNSHKNADQRQDEAIDIVV